MTPTLTLDQCGDTLTVREVCAVLGVSRTTWDTWRKARREPIAELEPRTYHPRYAKADVARYLANPHKGTGWQRRLQAGRLQVAS